MGHSNPTAGMPDDEVSLRAQREEETSILTSESAWLSCFHLTHSWMVAQRKSASRGCANTKECPSLTNQLLQLACRQHADRSGQ